MGKSTKDVPDSDSKPEEQAGRKGVPSPLKWVGAATAVLTLVFGVQQLIGVITSHVQRNRQVKELLATSEMQEQARDYAAAWSSAEQANRLTGGGGGTRAAEESLAMDWLENASAPDEQQFNDIVEKVTPVLDRAATSAQGQRKADLLAHLGWAAFLQSRDGVYGASPDGYYRQALVADPQNAYAHAMLGHWMMWNGGPMGEAEGEFDQALASGRRRDFVRRLQFAALENANNEDANLEMVRVLNAMRKNSESVDASTRSAAWSVYSRALEPDPWNTERVVVSTRRTQLLASLPPPEQLATFEWLFDNPGFDQTSVWLRDFYRGILADEAGQRTEALQMLRAVLSEISPAGSASGLRDGGAREAVMTEINARIARLSQP